MAGIFLLPRLQGNIRFEDFLTPALFVGVLLSINSFSVRHSLLPLIYFFYTFFITSFFIIFGNLPIEAYLIWGKEFQYILVFLIILGMPSTKKTSTFIQHLITYILIISSVSGVYLLVSGVRGYYGVGYFTESSPSLGMLMYFNCLFWSVYLYRKSANSLYLFLALLFFILVMLVGSRTGQLITMVFLFFVFLMNVRRKMYVYIPLAALILILTFSLDSIYDVLYNIKTDNLAIDGGVSRFATLLKFSETIQQSRVNSWLSVISQAFDNNFIVGCGRGCIHISEGGISLGMGGDNQYTKNFMEIGIIGSLLFMFTLLHLTVKLYKDPFIFKIYFPYMLAMLLVGMTMEVWQLSKGGSLFWFNTALMYSLLKEKYSSNHDLHNYSSS